jgi:hypothetical protein
MVAVDGKNGVSEGVTVKVDELVGIMGMEEACV